ncbi:hypothetical protein CARN8_7210007 [mine drainage metagenome]|uniref:Uncharacterized protein n=1 Tax=mine drainage metagenome TaxID=410659 RepID=A0A3P3ZRU6_9ZZZZ
MIYSENLPKPATRRRAKVGHGIILLHLFVSSDKMLAPLGIEHARTVINQESGSDVAKLENINIWPSTMLL